VITLEDISRAQVFGGQALAVAEAELAAEQPERAKESAHERWADYVRLTREHARHNHRTHKGLALDLGSRWFAELVSDTAPHQVHQKSVQCGESELLILREIAAAAAGLHVFHVVPTFGIRNRFVQERVNRSILHTDRYQELQVASFGDTDNLTLKNIGPGSVYWVSADTPKSFVEIVADLAVVDEVDQCDQRNLAMLYDRLSGERSVGATLFVGNPSHAEYGISDRYERSDRREWQVRCRQCGRWQPLDWFANVVSVLRDAEGNEQNYELRDTEWAADAAVREGRDLRMYCCECAAPLDRHENDRSACRWHAKYPRRPVHGYHVSKLFTHQTSLAELYAKFTESLDDPWKFQVFMNSDLGLPYSPPGSALTEEILRTCVRDYQMPQSVGDRACTMGVDVGKLMDVRISDTPAPGVRRAVFIGRVKSFDALTALMRRYHVRRCVVDAEPEVRATIEWANSFGTGRRRRVWRADLFDQYTPRDLPKSDPKDDDDGLLRLDRTQLLDMATRDYLRAQSWLPRNALGLLRGKWVAQMCAPKRVLATAADGTQSYRWVASGDDHHRFADAFDAYASRGLGITMPRADAWGEVEHVPSPTPYEGY